MPVVSRLLPIHAAVDRLQRITVCTRPFRAQGPRIEAEERNGKLLVHNYGHGGSGWSLSWGSAAEVVTFVFAAEARDIAVAGCGALGLTAALALQRAGARVTIYARDLPLETRSAWATGSWTPDSRIALTTAVDEGFLRRWERMARTSFAEFRGHLGQAGHPVDAQPRLFVSDIDPDAATARKASIDDVGFAHLDHRLQDLWPAAIDSSPDVSPYAGMYSRQVLLYRFNIPAYTRMLLDEFLERGGQLHRTEFHDAAAILALPEKTIVNCTSYASRTLFNDSSLIPVRGQIGWLPAQPDVHYGVQWERLNVVSRPDGIVVQFGAGGDNAGWNVSDETPDRAESEDAVRMLATLQQRLRR